MTRVSATQLIALAEVMPERDRQIVQAVARLRLAAGSQLARLFFWNVASAASRGRSARRVLASLCAQHTLMPLERRVGGVRAGSAGTVYALGPIGKRLMAYWQGEGLLRVRAVHQPGAPFVRHTLTVAEQYVRLVEAERAGRLELLAFEAEPACWRTYHGPGGGVLTLKPDAFARLGVGDFEQRSFVEADLGSEGRGALARQCRAYLAYYLSGREQAEAGVFPRVVWLTTTEARVRLLRDICAGLPVEGRRLFTVAPFTDAISTLAGE